MKGGDSVLYHALKLYKLDPELHWSAGGYVWPVDHTVDFAETDEVPVAASVRSPSSSPLRGLCSASEAGDSPEDLRAKVERSGAVRLSETGINLLSAPTSPGGVGKERVPFVQNGELEKLVVNVLLVVFVP